MQNTGGTNFGPGRVLVQITGVESESVESKLSNEIQCQFIVAIPVRLSPKPSGTVLPTCKSPESGGAMRPRGQLAGVQVCKIDSILVEAPAKMEHANGGLLYRTCRRV